MTTSSTFPGKEISENDVYQVFSLCYARLARNARQNFMDGDAHDGTMPLDYNLWILRNAHRTVLVDTGFGARAAVERGRQLAVDPVEAIARLGIDPDAIEDIVITHLHYDHAGNMGRFAKARFHLQEAEAGFAIGRCMCDRGMRAPFDVEDVVTLVRNTYADRVRFHDGDAMPLPGIGLHAMPGHTPGMQAVSVMTPRGRIVLASDVSHFYANFLRKQHFIGMVDVLAALSSYDRLVAIAGAVDRIIPGHDPKVRRLYPHCVIEGVELTALHETPAAHDVGQLMRLDDFEPVHCP